MAPYSPFKSIMMSLAIIPRAFQRPHKCVVNSTIEENRLTHSSRDGRRAHRVLALAEKLLAIGFWGGKVIVSL